MTSYVRASLLFGIFIAAFALLIVRLFYWQIVSADRLQKAAASQHFIEFTVPASRGSILDYEGNPLVINQPAFLAYAESHAIPDIRTFAAKIAPALSLDAPTLISELSDPNRVWVPLAQA